MTPPDGPEGHPGPEGVTTWSTVDAGVARPPVPDPDGPVDGGPTRRTGRFAHPWRIFASVFIVLGVAVLVGGYLWVDSEANPSGPEGPAVVVAVADGSGVDQVSGVLESKQVIGSSFAFKLWRQFNSVPGVQPGQYLFHRNSSFGTVRALLTAGPNVFPIDVPPGFTVAEVSRRVGQLPGHDQSAFQTLATGGAVRSPWEPPGSANLDGLLGTGVYLVLPGESDTTLLTQMIDRFDSEATAVGLAAGSARLGLTPYQVITIASIVEKEGVIAKNLGPVARVILNRLATGMPLQMDSTVLYAEGRDGGTVTAHDLALQTPYNTYLNHGLTPTPICFPSRAALEAALDPPAGSWRYFVVVQSDGTEAFADTYAAQLANEAIARQRGLP